MAPVLQILANKDNQDQFAQWPNAVNFITTTYAVIYRFARTMRGSARVYYVARARTRRTKKNLSIPRSWSLPVQCRSNLTLQSGAFCACRRRDGESHANGSSHIVSMLQSVRNDGGDAMRRLLVRGVVSLPHGNGLERAAEDGNTYQYASAQRQWQGEHCLLRSRKTEST
jgi:hypothetical protein